MKEIPTKKKIKNIKDHFYMLGVEMDFSYDKEKRKLTMDMGEPTPSKFENITTIDKFIEYDRGQIRINYEHEFPTIKVKKLDSQYSRVKKITIEFEDPSRFKNAGEKTDY